MVRLGSWPVAAEELHFWLVEGEGELATKVGRGEASEEAGGVPQGLSYAAEAAEGPEVLDFGSGVLGVQTLSAPLGRAGELQTEMYCPPPAFSGAAEEEAGRRLLPNLPAGA